MAALDKLSRFEEAILPHLDAAYNLARWLMRSDADGSAVGFAGGGTGDIPFSEMRWARPWRINGSFGPYPHSAADVVKPGDVVMVEPINVPSLKGEVAIVKTPAAFTLCQVPEISGALVPGQTRLPASATRWVPACFPIRPTCWVVMSS